MCRGMRRRKLCHRLRWHRLRPYVTPPRNPPPAIVSKPCQYGHLFTPCDNATNNTHAHPCICRVLQRQRLRHRLHGQILRRYVTPPPDPPPAIVSKPCQYGHLFTPCDNATNTRTSLHLQSNAKAKTVPPVAQANFAAVRHTAPRSPASHC